MTEIQKEIRQDSKERLLGNKSYVGDQEIIGILKVLNNDDKVIFEFNPTTGVLATYDEDGNLVWSVDTTTGVVTTGTHGAFKISDGTNIRAMLGYKANLFGSGKDYGFNFSREGYDADNPATDDINLIMSSKFTMPREVNISFGRWNYTNVLTYETLYDCACLINFDDWPDSSCYLEVTGKVGGGTAYYRLYNITDGVEIADSEVTTTSTTSTVFRSGAFTKPSGSKQLALQYKVSDSGYYTDIYTCRVVMRYT